ncbi:MAG: ATP synthase F1 subunit gamma [Clostridia bacterium]|nr:ATP synthase F1 subunit gamma [Clostridia bacterium]
MNDVKARIKSVQSTMQITKAMELVATSKLRRAKERAENTRPFYQLLSDAIGALHRVSDVRDSVWMRHAEGKTLFVMIAGDRGLAGGYNANIFRMTEQLAADCDAVYLPVGKKALEYCRHRGYPIYTESCEYVANLGVGDALAVAEQISESFRLGDVTSVVLVYTKFVSMISQVPVHETVLPLSGESAADGKEPLFEGDAEQLLADIVPDYVGGVLYSAVAESLASESGARRSAMSAANKNAGEMIDSLMLQYNRARQAVITQEITEIVSGAEAL